MPALPDIDKVHTNEKAFSSMFHARTASSTGDNISLRSEAQKNIQRRRLELRREGLFEDNLPVDCTVGLRYCLPNLYSIHDF